MFCVECGREGELIGPLCPECYSSKKVTISLPQYIDLTLCSHCSSFLFNGRWMETESVKEAAQVLLEKAISTPADMTVDDMTLELAEKDERTYEANVSVSLAVQGHRFERELVATIRLKHGSCSECSKQKGSYYEAVIQLRGDDRAFADGAEADLDGYVRDRIEAMRMNSREVFLTKVERVRGGIDFYVSTAQSARIVAREVQAMRSTEFKESSSLWGRRDGREVHRVTFLVRLPHFRAGDILTCASEDFYVHSMSKGIARCIALPSGDERQMKLHDLESCIVACPASSVRGAVVL
ncbi:MAG: 60S ribosomal export protein NMD3, partial [Methanobacteriota archaeon]